MFTSFLNWLSCCWTVYCSLLKIYSSITKELRSSAVISDMTVLTMLNFNWDKVTVTIMMLRFTDLRTLLMLFLIEIESNVLTTVIDVIIRCLSL